MHLEKIKQENLDLKRKLAIAKLWMEREVKSQIKKIESGKVSKKASISTDVFFSENVEEIIINKVSDFFGEILLLNTPDSIIENIISAEVSFYNLRENKNADGLGVITSYHKALDVLIETYITKGFRKFAKKNKQTQLRQNDILEKSLNSVVNSWYILSVGRLFHLIKLIKEDSKLYDYWECFKSYVEKYDYLNEILFDENFYLNFSKLANSEILWRKRHVWKISYSEVKKARKLLIWDFKDTDSLIYKFIEMWKIDI